MVLGALGWVPSSVGVEGIGVWDGCVTSPPTHMALHNLPNSLATLIATLHPLGQGVVEVQHQEDANSNGWLEQSNDACFQHKIMEALHKVRGPSILLHA